MKNYRIIVKIPQIYSVPADSEEQAKQIVINNLINNNIVKGAADNFQIDVIEDNEENK